MGLYLVHTEIEAARSAGEAGGTTGLTWLNWRLVSGSPEYSLLVTRYRPQTLREGLKLVGLGLVVVGIVVLPTAGVVLGGLAALVAYTPPAARAAYLVAVADSWLVATFACLLLGIGFLRMLDHLLHRQIARALLPRFTAAGIPVTSLATQYTWGAVAGDPMTLAILTFGLVHLQTITRQTITLWPFAVPVYLASAAMVVIYAVLVLLQRQAQRELMSRGDVTSYWRYRALHLVRRVFSLFLALLLTCAFIGYLSAAINAQTLPSRYTPGKPGTPTKITIRLPNAPSQAGKLWPWDEAAWATVADIRSLGDFTFRPPLPQPRGISAPNMSTPPTLELVGYTVTAGILVVLSGVFLMLVLLLLPWLLVADLFHASREWSEGLDRLPGDPGLWRGERHTWTRRLLLACTIGMFIANLAGSLVAGIGLYQLVKYQLWFPQQAGGAIVRALPLSRAIENVFVRYDIAAARAFGEIELLTMPMKLTMGCISPELNSARQLHCPSKPFYQTTLAVLIAPIAIWTGFWMIALIRTMLDALRLLVMALVRGARGSPVLARLLRECCAAAGVREPLVIVEPLSSISAEVCPLLPWSGGTVLRLSRGLVETLPEETVRVILAHELGHIRLHTAQLWLMQLGARLGLLGPSAIGVLVDYRAMEFEADAFASRIVGNSEQVVEALRTQERLGAERAVAALLQGYRVPLLRSPTALSWMAPGEAVGAARVRWRVWLGHVPIVSDLWRLYQQYFGGSLWGCYHPPANERIARLQADARTRAEHTNRTVGVTGITTLDAPAPQLASLTPAGLTGWRVRLLEAVSRLDRLTIVLWLSLALTAGLSGVAGLIGLATLAGLLVLVVAGSRLAQMTLAPLQAHCQQADRLNWWQPCARVIGNPLALATILLLSFALITLPWLPINAWHSVVGTLLIIPAVGVATAALVVYSVFAALAWGARREHARLSDPVTTWRADSFVRARQVVALYTALLLTGAFITFCATTIDSTPMGVDQSTDPVFALTRLQASPFLPALPAMTLGCLLLLILPYRLWAHLTTRKQRRTSSGYAVRGEGTTAAAGLSLWTRRGIWAALLLGLIVQVACVFVWVSGLLELGDISHLAVQNSTTAPGAAAMKAIDFYKNQSGPVARAANAWLLVYASDVRRAAAAGLAAQGVFEPRCLPTISLSAPAAFSTVPTSRLPVGLCFTVPLTRWTVAVMILPTLLWALGWIGAAWHRWLSRFGALGWSWLAPNLQAWELTKPVAAFARRAGIGQPCIVVGSNQSVDVGTLWPWPHVTVVRVPEAALAVLSDEQLLVALAHAVSLLRLGWGRRRLTQILANGLLPGAQVGDLIINQREVVFATDQLAANLVGDRAAVAAALPVLAAHWWNWSDAGIGAAEDPAIDERLARLQAETPPPASDPVTIRAGNQ